jgi:hypothetical protein
MKKVICMIALTAISYGAVYAALPIPAQMQQTDTSKMKVKKKTTKMKKKVKKDTAKKDTMKM